jgi:putative ABC transport system ATP-binding protein
VQSGGPAVEARGLTRAYRRGAETIVALKGIDLGIEPGEFLGLVGHSGAGKTTLLNLLGLMDQPTDGRLTVLGHEVTRRRVRFDALRCRNIGFVFQEFYLMPNLSALENVLLPTIWGRGRDLQPGRAKELLERVGLGHRMTHRPAELSGGEMQRVAVARSLINDPKLLLADEPTGNLDTRTRDEILNLLSDLNRGSGLTVVVATHDRGLEPRFSRVIRLEDGMVQSGG